jgi:hypothetical protein
MNAMAWLAAFAKPTSSNSPRDSAQPTGAQFVSGSA